MPAAVTTNAHAKANLLLRVLSQEESGYHSLETLFVLLEEHDDLAVERTERGITLDVEGVDTGPVEENLAYQAARSVLDATGNAFGVRIELTKRIPVQAGLGGGSSDGAATLHAVNALADNAVPRHELLQFAARLGSDVPFFCSGAPLALAWGRGERLFRIPPPAAAPVLLALPPFGISTQKAYAALDAGRSDEHRRGAVVLDGNALESWGGIGRLSGNDFEGPVFGKHPELRDLFERMARTGPLLVRLSGSGSAIIAIYRSESTRDGAAVEISEPGIRLIKTATRASPAPAPAQP